MERVNNANDIYFLVVNGLNHITRKNSSDSPRTGSTQNADRPCQPVASLLHKLIKFPGDLPNFDIGLSKTIAKLTM